MPSLWFFGWTICSSLSSSSFGGWTACSADSLVQNPWFRHWHRKPSRFTATGFLIHSSCPIAMDSWTFEIHWTWSELHWFDCSISGVFSGRTGIGRFSWALQDPVQNHPPCMEPHGIPVVHTCLFFMKGPVRLGCTACGGWKLLVDDGL